MKITSKMKSRLFRIAHSIKTKFNSFANALAQAWKLIKLQARMLVGNVAFSYYKVSGELRNAVGTLTEVYEPKGTGKQMPADSFLYFDVEKKSIRSCKLHLII